LKEAPMSLKTPLKRVLGAGAAKGVAEHWWLQRVTAVALLPLGLWFAYALLTLGAFDYATVVAWVREPASSILLIATILAVGYHSALGVQVVIEDYVGKTLRPIALMASTLAHVGLGVAAVFAVLKIAFGS
jgi:succinate dehydrogenase / fumarate reductase membrane anchor subunit